MLRGRKEVFVPSSIFCDRSLSPLEAVSEHLKEIKAYNFHDSGKLLNRDERTIWTCYHRAKKKRTQHGLQKKHQLHSVSIPLFIFHDRTLSSLEVIVVYLKERKRLLYREIGLLLNRNERTIWTCYHRSQKKMQKRTRRGRI